MLRSTWLIERRKKTYVIFPSPSLFLVSAFPNSGSVLFCMPSFVSGYTLEWTNLSQRKCYWLSCISVYFPHTFISECPFPNQDLPCTSEHPLPLCPVYEKRFFIYTLNAKISLACLKTYTARQSVLCLSEDIPSTSEFPLPVWRYTLCQNIFCLPEDIPHMTNCSLPIWRHTLSKYPLPVWRHNLC